jgi:hypothetical protein
MCGKTRAAITRRVESFDEDYLIGVYSWKIVPSMGRIVSQHEDFMPQSFAYCDEVIRRDASRITNCQRMVQHRALDRPPHIYLDESPRQPALRIGGRQDIAHHLRRGLRRVVIVYVQHRFPHAFTFLTRSIAAPHVVSEHRHA